MFIDICSTKLKHYWCQTVYNNKTTYPALGFSYTSKSWRGRLTWPRKSSPPMKFLCSTFSTTSALLPCCGIDLGKSSKVSFQCFFYSQLTLLTPLRLLTPLLHRGLELLLAQTNSHKCIIGPCTSIFGLLENHFISFIILTILPFHIQSPRTLHWNKIF